MCVYFYSWIFRLGNEEDNSGTIEREIRNIEIHPKYISGQGYYDVAVVKVDYVEFSEHMRPICLPTLADPIGDQFNNHLVTVTGWGSFNSSNVASQKLKTTYLSVFPSRYDFTFYFI